MNRISHLLGTDKIPYVPQNTGDLRRRLQYFEGRSILITYKSRQGQENKISDVLNSFAVVSVNRHEANQPYSAIKLSLRKSGTLYFIDGVEEDLDLVKNTTGLIHSIKLDLS